MALNALGSSVPTWFQPRAQPVRQQPARQPARQAPVAPVDGFEAAGRFQASGSLRPELTDTGVRLNGSVSLNTPRFNARFGVASASVRGSVSAGVTVDLPRGTQTVPNIGDPSSWQVGTRIAARVTGSFETDASLRLGGLPSQLGLQDQFERTRTREFSAERLDERTVRLQMRDLGNQRDRLAALGVGLNSQQGVSNTRTADVDITTEQGRAAYQRFLREGQLPTQSGTGVSVSNEQTRTDQRGLDFLQRLRLDTGSSNVTRTEDPDGTVRARGELHLPGGREPERFEATRSPDGTVAARFEMGSGVSMTQVTPPGGATQREVQLQFDERSAEFARRAFGLPDGSGPVNVRLSEAQARDLIQRLNPGMTPGGDLRASLRFLSRYRSPTELAGQLQNLALRQPLPSLAAN